MQVKKTAALCALAFAAMAGTAHAAWQDDVNDANANGRVIFISGASAVQKGFTDIIANTFTGTPTYFSYEGKSSSSADYVAVAGTFASGAGAWSGQKGIIIYRVKGGSVYGVNHVARAESITSLKVNSTECGTDGEGSASKPFSCPTTSLIPDAGVSDVAPKFFKAPYNTEGEPAEASLSAAELAVLTPTPLYGMAFGIPVTTTLSSDVVFNRAMVSAIMTGNVGAWEEVTAEDSGEIVLCRRTPGSGTQATMNMWAGNFPCTANYNVPVDREASIDLLSGNTLTVPAPGDWGGMIVIENSSSSHVRSCLNAAANGGSYTTADRAGNTINVDFGTGGHKAIGVLSMDSLKDSKTSGAWQFRSLDGAGKIVQDTSGAAPTTTGTGKFPTIETYENGDWDLQGWVSFNRPARTTGAKKAVLDFFVKNAQNPAVLANIADLKFVTAAIPGKGYTGPQVLDAAYVGGDQCAPYNRNYND